MFKERVALAVILTTIILGGLLYVNQKYFSPREETDGTACSADAMLCPDGSYVGRREPNCEFEKCPIPLELIEIPIEKNLENSENELKIE